jgi:hypothetical protein
MQVRIRDLELEYLDLVWFAVDALGQLGEFWVCANASPVPASVLDEFVDVYTALEAEICAISRGRGFQLTQVGEAIAVRSEASMAKIGAKFNRRTLTDPSARGFYHYDGRDRNQKHQPYECLCLPDPPILVTELPVSAQAVVSRTVLPVVDFGKCLSIPPEVIA